MQAGSVVAPFHQEAWCGTLVVPSGRPSWSCSDCSVERSSTDRALQADFLIALFHQYACSVILSSGRLSWSCSDCREVLDRAALQADLLVAFFRLEDVQ